MKHIKKISLLVIMAISLSACEKFLDKKPDQKQSTISTAKDLQALLDARILNQGVYPTAPDVASDDYYLSKNDYDALTAIDARKNYIWDGSADMLFDWQTTYSIVFTANLVLENCDRVKETGDADADLTEIRGAAYFYRAFCFLSLLQEFSLPYEEGQAAKLPGISLRLTSNITAPNVRHTMEESYRQVISDFKNAAKLLPPTTLVLTRPSKTAAYAMLARTSLNMRNYTAAGLYADSCLQLQRALIDYNTVSLSANVPFPRFHAEVLFHAVSSGRDGVMNPSKAKVDTLLFQGYADNDLRKVLFYKSVNGGHAFKGDYGGGTSSGLFCGPAVDEVYLIKAESAIRASQIGEGLALLNDLLLKRYKSGTFIPYGLPMAQQDALDLVLKERRKELAFRGGLRWQDIRRLNAEPQRALTLERKLGEENYRLPPGDKRFAFLIPTRVIEESGIQQNER